MVASDTTVLGLVKHLERSLHRRRQFARHPNEAVRRGRRSQDPVVGLAHMTTEIARHLGHMDILREQIDDVTGR
jgi:hypothetical protein